MPSFSIPRRNDVSARNQRLFDRLEHALEKVPNLYATLAYSENALSTYLNLENSPSSLSKKQLEVVNITVSQVNECSSCVTAHTVIAEMNGFTRAEIEEIRTESISFDPALEVLARLTRDITRQRGHIAPVLLDQFFEAGYTKEQLMDLIIAVGNRTIANIIHVVAGIPVDFPVPPELDAK